MQVKRRSLITIFLVTLVLFGCNLPSATSTVAPETSPTIYVQTLSALQTRAVMTATAQGFAAAPTTLPGTPLPVTGGTPGMGTIVINDTLCWQGPGPQYEVISAIFAGTQVQLLGKANIPNWYIVRNPIYLDPCWAWAADLQIDPAINLATLPVFNVPATPTTTPLPTLTGTIPAPTTPAPSATPTSFTRTPRPTASPTASTVTSSPPKMEATATPAPSSTPPPPSATP